MKMEFVLHLENDLSITKEGMKLKAIDALKRSFHDVTDESLEFYLSNDLVKISYIINQFEVNTNGTASALCYLTLSSDLNGMKDASILDKAYELLQQGTSNSKERFLVITILDERSKYYAIKAYPYYCNFETKLRCLILKLLTKSFGVLWAQKTLTRDMECKLKERLKGADYRKLAKEAIFEMDFNMLETYLFSKTRDVQPEDIIDSLLDDDKCKGLTIKDLKTIIAQAKPKSLWERYFVDEVTIPELELKLSEIRVNRNKIAHNKRYELKDYKKDRKLLNEFCKQFDIAIESVAHKSIDPREAVATVGNLITFDYPGITAIARTVSIIIENIGPVMDNINARMSQVAQLMSTYDCLSEKANNGIGNAFRRLIPYLVSTETTDTDASQSTEVEEPDNDLQEINAEETKLEMNRDKECEKPIISGND